MSTASNSGSGQSRVSAAALDSYIVDRGIVRGATTIHHINPAELIEKIIRERIYESFYWKEQCFGLNAATICDKIVVLKFIGGQYANQKVTPFLCLVFKLIQIQPPPEIVREYLVQDDFKYLRAVAAFYIRLFFKPQDVFLLLEPYLTDYRKLRIRKQSGISLTYIDEFIDALLTQERVCDIALPRMTSRTVLEDQGKLEPRESALASELDSSSDDDDDDDNNDNDMADI